MQADKDRYFGKQKMTFMSNERVSECVFAQGQVADSSQPPDFLRL